MLDRVSKSPITKSNVEIHVEQPGGISSETKPLQAVVINNVESYGAYVQLKPKTSYLVTVRVRTAESPQPVVARFEHRQY